MIRVSSKLILVRHSQPQIEPDVPPSEWSLNDAGRRRAELLAGRKLQGYSPDVIWSSLEPKALETAEVIGCVLGVPVEAKDGLEEHHREKVPFFSYSDEFRRAVEGIFLEPDRTVMGSESGSQTLTRFSAAVNEILDNDVADAIVVTHGTVMALYVASISGIDPMAFWRRQQMPCFVVVDAAEKRVGPIVS